MFHTIKHKKLIGHLAVALLVALTLGACTQPTTPQDANEGGTPATPSNVTAVAGNTSVTLAWSANSEADLAHYNVYQGTARGDLLKVAEVPAGTESYVATGLPNDLIHHFSLDAETSAGERSERTEEVSATPQADAASTCLFDDASTVFGSCTFAN